MCGLPLGIVAGVLGGRGQVALLVDAQTKQVDDELVVEAPPLEPDELHVQPAGQDGEYRRDDELENEDSATLFEEDRWDYRKKDHADQQRPLQAADPLFGLSLAGLGGLLLHGHGGTPLG